MKNISTQPAESRLARLYQERKARHPMPKQLQDEILGQLKSAQSQPNWRKAPVWAATLAACFVLVLSFQYLPQQQSQNVDEAIVLQDIAKTGQDGFNYEAQPEAQQQSHYEFSPSKPESAAPAMQEQAQLMRTKAQPVERLADAESVTALANTKPITIGQQVSKKQKSIPAAPSPSLATTGAIVVQAKLLPVSEGQTQRIAIDCLGKPISLGEHNLARLSDDQWLDIHFHHDGTIMRIIKNQDFKGCPGD